MSQDLSVKTRYGTFNGFVDEKGVQTWLGIPYAQAPIGKLRWQAPQPLQPTDKTFDAKKYGASAIQAAMKVDNPIDDDDEQAQSEDCLTLNIWRRDAGKNKPVMVFIYGGAFVSGHGSEEGYKGTNFVLSHDVIIVTFNYRLNIFGFLNLSEIDKNFEDSGYVGIKDQIAALKWVKENISEFGGNPDNITIFGESAGSISCMFLTVTPAAKGLFQKAIPQSGSLDFYSEPEYSAKVAEDFMKFSGAKTMGELMKKSTDEMRNIYSRFLSTRISNLMDFLPTCDGKFLPSNPFQALKDGAARGIKILTGTTADEWRCFWLATEKFFDIFRDAPKELSPVLRRYNAQTPEEVYKDWLKNRSDTEENFIDFVNNVDWRIGQELSAEYQANFEDVYFYVFTQWVNEKLRACHALDLPYTFNVPYIESNPAPNLVKVIQASWAAFATTGNPDNEFIPHWEKYSADNRQTMELNSKGCVCHKDLNTENLNALRYVYEN